MFNHDDSFNAQSPGNNQFVISYELLCLLQWLVEHDSGTLKRLIGTALEGDLKKKIQNIETMKEQPVLEEIQESIIDFFGLLETLLLETLHEHSVKQAVEKNLMPAIDQVDTTECDYATVRSSINEATANIQDESRENAKELFCKELLRHWKPGKKSTIH